MIKYHINLILKTLNNLYIFSFNSLLFLFISFLNSITVFSDKDKDLTIILIKEEIIEEYIICGN